MVRPYPQPVASSAPAGNKVARARPLTWGGQEGYFPPKNLLSETPVATQPPAPSMHQHLVKTAPRFAQSAIEALLEGDREVFALHAATAFEHLAKARLAHIHPSLIADGRDFQSLLHACGNARLVKQPDRGPKSITLSEAIVRVAQIDTQVRPHTGALKLLADARNGVAHIGQETEGLDRTVVVPFARSCEVLLPALGLTRETFWGDYLQTIDARLSTAVNEAHVRVTDKITRAKSAFEQRFGAHEEGIAGELLTLILENYNFDKYHGRLTECPACGTEALQTGYDEVEWEVDVEYEGPDEFSTNGYPRVTVVSEGLRCGACGLELDGVDELRAADVDTEWEVTDADAADFYDRDLAAADFYDPDPDER